MSGRLRRTVSGRMDVLAKFAGYVRTPRGWLPQDRQAVQVIQPDASFHTIREDALALKHKGLIKEVDHYRYAITDDGIAEWNRLWPDFPYRLPTDG